MGSLVLPVLGGPAMNAQASDFLALFALTLFLGAVLFGSAIIGG
jgi:hypothetical protein